MVDYSIDQASPTGQAGTVSSVDTGHQRVVVHFMGGKLLKGYTRDFTAGTDIFTLISDQQEDRGKTHQVRVADLKAVFFVRRLDGNKFYQERKKFNEVGGSHLRGHRIELRFKDGEIIRGTTDDYSVGKQGFFVTPVDPKSNNHRIYVVSDALRRVRFACDGLL